MEDFEPNVWYVTIGKIRDEIFDGRGKRCWQAAVYVAKIIAATG
jgi:hypothetical protein